MPELVQSKILLSKQVKSRRKAANLSLEALANLSGVGKSTIGYLEAQALKCNLSLADTYAKGAEL
jgi:transcriptional regulator with XRE-family HTH domain